jgi:hypothetical protein
MNASSFFSLFGIQPNMNIIYSFLYQDERIHFSRVCISIYKLYRRFNELFNIIEFNDPVDLLNEFNKGVLKTRKVILSDLIEMEMDFLNFDFIIPTFSQKFISIIRNNIIYEERYGIRKYIQNKNNYIDVYNFKIYMLKEEYDSSFLFYYIKRSLKDSVLLEEDKNYFINFINNGGNIMDLEISIPMEYSIKRYKHIYKLIQHMKEKQYREIEILSNLLSNKKDSYNLKVKLLKDK